MKPIDKLIARLAVALNAETSIFLIESKNDTINSDIINRLCYSGVLASRFTRENLQHAIDVKDALFCVDKQSVYDSLNTACKSRCIVVNIDEALEKNSYKVK